ncbi:MAG: ATP-binding protein [Planctomycetes bacterium]|nr:ATP-binding protein [Planctomycetota bacterium]
MVALVPKRLAPRLIAGLVVILVAVEGLFSYFSLKSEEAQLLREAVLSTDQLARSLTSATWHAMLADHREDAYRVMETMGHRQGVDRIRMVNAHGAVTFTTDKTGQRAAYDNETPVAAWQGEPAERRLSASERSRFLEGPTGRRKLGLRTPIYNEISCRTAACHAHPEETPVLGVLDVVVDIGNVDDELHALAKREVAMSATHLLLVAAFVVIFTRVFVSKPIGKLIEGTQAVSVMDLDRPLEIATGTELDALSDAFNVMRERLRVARDELAAFTQELEEKVEQRSRQLDAARAKLIHSDRLASLGQLAASVAHEVNNPIGSVINLTMLLRRIMGSGGIPPGREEEFRRHLQRIEEETTRVGRIVSDLLSFSRRSKPQRDPSDLNAIVGKTIELLHHKLDLAGVDARLDLDPALAPVPCDRSQIEQVLINLVMNAAEAVGRGGKVVVRTAREPGTALLEVRDNGPGIPADVLPRIYDPFFTTKDAGKGVGLGLAVVYGIVEAHGGSIDVASRAGEGATFTVRLPMNPNNGHPEVQR